MYVCLTELFEIELFICIHIIQFRNTVKKVDILLFNTNNFAQRDSFVCTQVNGSKYCYVSLKSN